MKETPPLALAAVLEWLRTASNAELQAVFKAAEALKRERFGGVGSHVVTKGTAK